METVKIQLFPGAQLPKRASDDAIGFDVFAYHIHDKKEISLPFILKPKQNVLVGVGFKVVVPEKMDCQIRPRSGLAKRHGIQILNSPGTLDPDYRGEAGVILYNTSNRDFKIEKGMRIAQLIFGKVEIPVFLEVNMVPEKTRRGARGFGSTGMFDIELGTTNYDRDIKQKDIFYMRMAFAASYRSNCVRGCKTKKGKYVRDERGFLVGQTRRFGCVIVKDDTVISHGYNGPAKGQPLCEELGCLRDELKIPSGTMLEECRSIHAEQKAINRVAGSTASIRGAIVYVTAEPCKICSKLLSEAGIQDLVILQGEYPLNGLDNLKKAGISIRLIKRDEINW